MVKVNGRKFFIGENKAAQSFKNVRVYTGFPFDFLSHGISAGAFASEYGLVENLSIFTDSECQYSKSKKTFLTIKTPNIILIILLREKAVNFGIPDQK